MPRTGHIALAGAPNVGKSSLLNAIVGHHLAIVSPRAQATRLPVVGLVTQDDAQFIFHDLPGLLEPSYLMQSRMRELALATLRRMDVVLHLHPAPEAPAPALERVAGLADPPLAAPVLTVYTKGDLVTPARRAELTSGAEVVSARDGAGIEPLMTVVRGLLPEGEFEHDPEDIGTQPIRFFVVEYLREAAFELLEDELPYGFTAEVEEFREAERPVYIRVTLFVERESQKRIVIGRGGQTIKAIGARARQRVEELIGAPVYLDCWVKVLPHWRKSASALTRFGFPASETP
ncbi:MAG TPA: GTPase Era [Gemmatimonadales bacterium]|jgi:GTP-binding protein Era|nr:GTPase Era [Gemmatimonadales bacterium]